MSWLRDLFRKLFGSSASPVPQLPGPITPSIPSDPSQRAKGIDIYHYDDIQSWEKIKAAGYQFAIIKSSQVVADPKFIKYFTEAKAHGLICGAYHFMNYNVSGETQALLCYSMLQKAGGLNATDLPVACDWEYSDGHDPTSHEIAIVQDFLVTIKKLTNRLPIVYCSDYIPITLGNPAWLRQYPLWIARYRISGPQTKGWTFWQYSGSETIPGIANEADANYFAGNLEELKKFIAST